jgi:hypothetical protein
MSGPAPISGADTSAKKAKGKPPNKFTGAEKSSVSWEEWERKFLNHMKNVEKNPESEWVALLWTYLEGDAERAFLAIIGNRDPSEVPYEEVTRGMVAGPFPKAKTRHALLSELRTIKMEQKKDGYDAYQNKFARIIGELSQVGYKPDGVNLCVDFLNGLVSVMKFELQVRRPHGWDNFEELTKTAKEYWTAYIAAGNLKDSGPAKDGVHNSGGKGDGNKRPPPGKSAKGSGASTPKKPRQAEVHNTILPRVDKDGKEIMKENIAEYSSQGKCTFCHRPTHKWRACRTYAGKAANTLPAPYLDSLMDDSNIIAAAALRDTETRCQSLRLRHGQEPRPSVVPPAPSKESPVSPWAVHAVDVLDLENMSGDYV